MAKFTEEVSQEINDVSTEIAHDIIGILIDKYEGTPTAVVLGALEAAKYGIVHSQLAN